MKIRHCAHIALANSETAAREQHHLTAEAEELLDEVKQALANILPASVDHEIDHRDHLLMHRIEDCLKELSDRGLHNRRKSSSA